MRYREILEAYYAGQKQNLLRQIRPPANGEYAYNYSDADRPRLTLRMLQKLRIQKDKEQAEIEDHLAFLPIMYTEPECDDKKKKKKKRKKKRTDNKIASRAETTAKQSLKAKDKQETDAGRFALNYIKRRDSRLSF